MLKAESTGINAFCLEVQGSWRTFLLTGRFSKSKVEEGELPLVPKLVGILNNYLGSKSLESSFNSSERAVQEDSTALLRFFMVS